MFMNQQEFKNVLIKLKGAIMHVPLFPIFLKKAKTFFASIKLQKQWSSFVRQDCISGFETISCSLLQKIVRMDTDD